MKGLDFPIINTINKNSDEFYDLNSPESREKYFYDKVGKEIEDLKDFMAESSFVAYLLGKKQAGKGTYTKLLAEIFGSDKIRHLSIGDLVREVEKQRADKDKEKKLMEYLEKNYRGFIPLEKAYQSFIDRGTSGLIPTEFILTLVKREIELSGRASLFIDGFPRNLDQVSYSLYFRELINYRQDQDIFIILDVDEAIIDERIKYRRVCPKCQTSRNLKLFPSSDVRYDEETSEFYLMCDNPECEPTRMVGKEGDDLGIEAIRDRIEMDDEVIRKAFDLYGIPKILLRNSIPTEIALSQVDEYELTKMEEFALDDDGKIIRIEKNWTIKNDNGIESFSVKSPAFVIESIKRLHQILI